VRRVLRLLLWPLRLARRVLGRMAAPARAWWGRRLARHPRLQRIWQRRFWRLVICGAPVLLVLNLVGLHLSSQSWFCGTCHKMDAYYDSWEGSDHKDIACVDCHIPPGLDSFVWAKINGLGQLVDSVLGRTHGKPSAAVSDAACTRSGCHDIAEVRANNTDRIGPRQTNYIFDHDNHLDVNHVGIKMRCATCHSHIEGNQHFSVNTGVCLTCHMTPLKSATKVTWAAAPDQAGPAGAPGMQPIAQWQPTTADVRPASNPDRQDPTRRCNKCHEAPKQPLEYRGVRVVHSEFLEYGAACESCHHQATAGAKPVEDVHCYSCHDFGTEKMTTVEQLHHEHSAGDHKVECLSCHGSLRHGPAAQTMRLDQFDCRSCHVGQHEVQRKTCKKVAASGSSRPASLPTPTTAAAPTGEPISPMFLTHVDCTGCHIRQRPLKVRPDTGAVVAAATAEACDRCHKPGLGKQLVPMWQKNSKQLYQVAAEQVAAIDASDDPRVKQLKREAEELLTLVRVDRSWGVHNPRYTEALLKRARSRATEAAAVANKNKRGSR